MIEFNLGERARRVESEGEVGAISCPVLLGALWRVSVNQEPPSLSARLEEILFLEDEILATT